MSLQSSLNDPKGVASLLETVVPRTHAERSLERLRMAVLCTRAWHPEDMVISRGRESVVFQTVDILKPEYMKHISLELVQLTKRNTSGTLFLKAISYQVRAKLVTAQRREFSGYRAGSSEPPKFVAFSNSHPWCLDKPGEPQGWTQVRQPGGQQRTAQVGSGAARAPGSG